MQAGRGYFVGGQEKPRHTLGQNSCAVLLLRFLNDSLAAPHRACLSRRC
jgi:hypothetical protein